MTLPAKPSHRSWSARQLDVVFLAILGLNALLALAIGREAGQLALAAQGALGLLLLGLPVLRWQAGRLPARLWLSTLQLAMVAWQIHLSGGRELWHFNVFVSLSLLLAYRDWRPILLMAGGFIVHHLAFDRLLAAGVPLYCLSQPDLTVIFEHAAFVAVQGLALARVAWVLEREWREADELAFLVNAMGREGRIRLSLDVLRADTPTGQRLKDVQQRMTQALREVHEAEAHVHDAALAMATGSDTLRERTLTTAEGLKNAAMCMEQICVIVNDSTAASNEARTMSANAARLASDGEQLVAEVVQTMAQIDASSRRIADITGVIDGIAFQTNILALNAAVEAARAGEHGRGFAVVAAEVRSLAQRSAAAAREIKGVIGESTGTVAAGARQVESAGRSMAQLAAAVRRVGDLFVGVTKDTHEHTEGLQMVTQSIQELGAVTQQNVAVADDSAAAAQELQRQTARLAAVLGQFSLGAGYEARHERMAEAVVPVPAAPRPGATAAAPPPPSAPPAPLAPPASPARLAAPVPAPAPAEGGVEFF